ncbi:MAG: molybdate ABC transporter substrate-binding protein [Phycisphaerales bacterium]
MPGCEDQAESTVIIFAGSSMTQALQEIETRFELAHPTIDLELIFAGSQTLATQINAGAHADLFISADQPQINRVDGFGMPQVLVGNTIVAITSIEQAKTINEAIKNSQRIILAQHDVPAGRYTQQALSALGMWDRAEPKVVSQEHSVRSVLMKVVSGEADLGFVYRTDARNINNPDAVRIINFPQQIPAQTQTWITKRSDNEPGSPTDEVFTYITTSPEARTTFDQLGFHVYE